MVGATLAIGDSMLMLVSASLWVGGEIVGIGLIGVGTLGGLALAARRFRRGR